MTLEINLITATIDDAENINDLINTTYRGNNGWTKETKIVDGKRSSAKDIESLIKDKNSHLLVAKRSEKIVACICLEQKDNKAYIGSFAVNPIFQNNGIGKQILSLAERYATENLELNKLIMAVISQRKELISFYERRGYKRTGKIFEYPVHLNVGTPIIEGLTVEYLEKST